MARTKSFGRMHPELTSKMNANFVIRVFNSDPKNRKKRKDSLCGAGQIHKYLDEKTAISEFERCLSSPKDNLSWHDRKFIRIEFSSK